MTDIFTLIPAQTMYCRDAVLGKQIHILKGVPFNTQDVSLVNALKDAKLAEESEYKEETLDMEGELKALSPQELKIVASKKGIDVKNITKKPDLINAILEADKQPSQEKPVTPVTVDFDA